MAVSFADLHTESGLNSLNSFLSGKTYISGDQLTKDDVKVYAAVVEKPGDDFPNASRWYATVASQLASSFPGKAVGVKIAAQSPAAEIVPVEEATKEQAGDDDHGLFEDETEEEHFCFLKFQLFAEKVRDHKDLVSRWAVLQETRVEYFRGKDFVSFMRNHPELKDILESDMNLEVEDIANALLEKNLLVRCDRVVKTVRPGKRKLSSWPAHLEIFPDQIFSENDAFFAWTFVNKRPLWQTLLSLLWPVLTLAICLFPIYPHQAKLLILYSCAGVLLVILCLLLFRALIFGAAWILLGRRVWFFPNILAEEATLRELFRFWPKKDEEERPKWTARLFFAVVAALAILLLRHHAPDEAARARYQKRVSNIIDDVLEWDPRLALSGMMDKPTVVNGTDPNDNFTSDGSKTSFENTASSGDTVEEPILDRNDEEIIGKTDDDHLYNDV